MFTSETLVKNIRKTIDLKGLKQKTIAKNIGKTEQEFSNMLNFRSKINAEDVFYIAEALQVNINDLYQGS
jgi:transcriptional regulator with XRE-family HTH domain